MPVLGMLAMGGLRMLCLVLMTRAGNVGWALWPACGLWPRPVQRGYQRLQVTAAVY